MIKFAIFDLDGTLIQTMESIMKTGNLMLNDFGYAGISTEKYKRFVGYGAKNLVKELMIEAGDKNASQLEQAYAVYMKYFAEHATFEVKPYIGIEEMIAEMQDRNIKLAVLTNKPHAMAGDVMDKCFPVGTFEFIQGQSEDFPRKPDPTAAIYIAKEMGAENMREVMFMGDSDADMQTAKNAGMISVGASWGFRPAQELLENGCEILLEKPLDLIPYLEKEDI